MGGGELTSGGGESTRGIFLGGGGNKFSAGWRDSPPIPPSKENPEIRSNVMKKQRNWYFNGFFHILHEVHI